MFEVLFESEYLKKYKDRYKMTRVFLTKYHCSRFQYELIDLTYIYINFDVTLNSILLLNI